MASFKEVNGHLAAALEEIGQITPWWSEEDGMYVFEHEAYPMVCSGHAKPEESREQYLRVLRNFIRWRLDKKIADTTDKMTPGKGGKREGAGRPPLAPEFRARNIRVPGDIIDKVKMLPGGWNDVRQLLAG